MSTTPVSNIPSVFNELPIGNLKSVSLSSLSIQIQENQPEICKYLFVFLLKGNKYFIYSSLTQNSDIDSLMNECEIYYDFVKYHTPLKCVDIIRIDTGFEIDAVVKQYMLTYGFENVRGGTYSDVELPAYFVEMMRAELKTANLSEIDYLEDLRQIIDLYKIMGWTREEDWDGEVRRIQTAFHLYNSEKEKLRELKYFTESIVIDGEAVTREYEMNSAELLHNIESMHARISRIHDAGMCIEPDTAVCIEYRNLLPRLKQLARIYVGLESNIAYSRSTLIHPEFLLDDYYPATFSQNNDLRLKQIGRERKEETIQLCKLFAHIYNCVLNRISELEYDVSTYPSNADWIYPRVLYILNKMRIDNTNTLRDEIHPQNGCTI